MNWETNRKHLGEIKSGKSVNFTFIYLGIPNIKGVKVGCGSCTTASLINNVLRVKYTPGSFPKHLSLKGQKEQKVTKSITVTYETGDTETLYFTANLIK